jgi:hypothetical protein
MKKIYFCILYEQFIFPSFALVLQDLNHSSSSSFFVAGGFCFVATTDSSSQFRLWPPLAPVSPFL